MPEKHWTPKMTPWWFLATNVLRRSALREQMFVSLQVQGVEHLKAAREKGWGVLLTPNHSFHWDYFCLMQAAQQVSWPFYIMTDKQVFVRSSWFERKSLQHWGCFSVDRLGIDLQATRVAVDVLQNRKHPLVVFPEGNVCHTNDRITAFRDGAVALAMKAASGTARSIVVIPVAIKQWYLADPTPSVRLTLAELEKRLYWRVQDDGSELERIQQIAEAVLSLKEIERLQRTQSGTLDERTQSLTRHVLTQVESRYGIVESQASMPERIRDVRRRIIEQQKSASTEVATGEQRTQWARDLEDVVFINQLHCYPADYLIENPSVERMAETVDRLEEELLGATYPTVREKKHVQIRFGEPVALPQGEEGASNPSILTNRIEAAVQGMLDMMNREHPVRFEPR